MMVPGTAAENFADNALEDANVPTGIMTQLARSRRNGIYEAFSTRSLAGLGNDGSCPDSAPYAVPGWPGRCSNVQSNLTATNNPVTTYVDAPITNASISQQNNDARFGLQLTEDRGIQEQLAAEAQSQGAAQGYNVQCRIITNTVPAMGGSVVAPKYQAICTVNGQDGYSAALLVREGGWNQARIEAHLPASTYVPPVIQTPAKTTTSTQQSQASGGGNTQVASSNQSQGQGQSQGQSQSQQWPSDILTADGPGSITGAGMISSALSQPVVLIGLAAVAYFMLKGKN